MSETNAADPATKLVLLVDDDESLLDLMEHVVKKEGFRTDRAVDGPETLRKAEALNPDLIVLDMMLPGLGGGEVLRELRASGKGGVPVIVITGRQMDEGGVAAVRAEPAVREFMQKPVRPAVLAETLHRLLGTKPRSRPGGGA